MPCCFCIYNGLVDIKFFDVLNRVSCFGYYMLYMEELYVSGSVQVVMSSLQLL